MKDLFIPNSRDFNRGVGELMFWRIKIHWKGRGSWILKDIGINESDINLIEKDLVLFTNHAINCWLSTNTMCRWFNTSDLIQSVLVMAPTWNFGPRTENLKKVPYYGISMCFFMKWTKLVPLRLIFLKYAL